MNKLFKILFRMYHILFHSVNPSCRYTPTCSQYLIDAVEKYGTVKGLRLTAARIFFCNPFSKRPIYDPA